MGGTGAIAADLRVLAATDRDLWAAAQGSAFRQDLYFRLCVLSVEMPPLRQRRQDFVRKLAKDLGSGVESISDGAVERLVEYHWPGNVRELENAIRSAVAVGSTEGILPEDLPESVLPAVDSPDDVVPRYSRAALEAKRELILKAYQQARGSHVHAAALLGPHPSSLLRLMRTLDLQAALRKLSAKAQADRNSHALAHDA